MNSIYTYAGTNPFAAGLTNSPVFVYTPAQTDSLSFIPMTNFSSGIDVSQYFGAMPIIPPTKFDFGAILKTIMGGISTPNLDFISQIGQSSASASASATERQGQSEVSVSDDNTDVGTVSKEGMLLKGKGKGTKYGPEFLKKVKRIAKNLNCNYRDLLAIFNSEFGVEANKTAKNGAVGLICFMPQYFDTKKIVKMSPIDQLDVVEDTIMKAKRMAGFSANAKLSKADLYALVFLPARANQEVLCKRGEGNSFYESNAALDYNKDGKITKQEMAHRIDNKYVSDQSFLA
jgi:hypothetical protein